MPPAPPAQTAFLTTAAPAFLLLAAGCWPIMNHPNAGAYQPGLALLQITCCLLGGLGAAGAPLATTERVRWLARGAMALALLGMVGLSLVVFTDGLCLKGYRTDDGSCAWE